MTVKIENLSFLFDIPLLSQERTPLLRAKIDQKTKPLGALGQLESLALQIGLIQDTLTPRLEQTALFIFAGDHGIAEAGVSVYPSSVTAQMVSNFLNGGAAVSVFAKQQALDLWIVDAGVNADLPLHARLLQRKIAKGTANFLQQPAMTDVECLSAIKAGADIVLQYAVGQCVGFGEMGIGNTSSAAVIMHCLTDIPLEACVGRGTGLNDSQLQHKMDILQSALKNKPVERHPFNVLMTFGGFEIAMMVGAMLQAAALQKVIVIDGFITTAALLVACRLFPQVRDYCVFSHASHEQGHRKLLHYFNAQPLLQLDLRLGEGSGVALAYPLLQSAVLFLNEMATFDEAGVDKNTA
jgi:nicotinate-nucleotide--dimethylbenzimidazole phosphoribosyltransferase